MSSHSSFKHRFDDLQQRHAILGFPVAIVKRYYEDQVGHQAALITYYAFLSLFPLLLIFITILSIMVTEDPALRASVSEQFFQYFPLLGDELQKNVRTLKSSGFTLFVQLLILLYGARGLSLMLQESFNHVWRVDKRDDPGLVGSNLRGVAMMIAVGVGIVTGAAASYIIGNFLEVDFIGALLITLLNVAITCGLFLLVFRLGTSNRVRFHWLVPGAILAGMGVLIVQHFGGYFAANHLQRLQGAYGSFALTLGIMFWLYIQAHIIMLSLEITAVRQQRDWPRSLFDSEAHRHHHQHHSE